MNILEVLKMIQMTDNPVIKRVIEKKFRANVSTNFKCDKLECQSCKDKRQCDEMGKTVEYLEDLVRELLSNDKEFLVRLLTRLIIKTEMNEYELHKDPIAEILMGNQDTQGLMDQMMQSVRKMNEEVKNHYG